MSPTRKFFSEPGCGFRTLLQSRQSIAEQGAQIQASGRLIQSPESLRIIGIQFQELSNQRLGDLGRYQVRSIQGAKQCQQVKPGDFEAGAEIGGCTVERRAM